MTSAPILVTGGTGTLGRLVVALLRDDGYKVRVLSRHSREAVDGVEFVTGDLATGEGVEAAMEGAEIVVHCAGSSKGDEDKAENLVRAASRAGAQHLIYISVAGADRIPVVSRVDRAMFGCFASKLAAERVAAESGAGAFRAGANLAPERAVGRRTWEEFLAAPDRMISRRTRRIGRGSRA